MPPFEAQTNIRMRFPIFFEPEGEAPPAGGEAPPAGGEAPPIDTSIPPEDGATPPEGSDFSRMRDGLTDEALKKQAGQYNTFEDMIKSNIKMRNKGAEGFKVPGEDADPQEISDFRKTLGVPEEANGYEWPDMAEGQDEEAVKESQGKWGEILQKANVSVEGAKMLMEAIKEDTAQTIKAEQDADADFANETKEILAQEWGKDYEANTDYANKAVAELFGSTLEDVQHIQTKDGKFILDHPAFVRAFSQVGREMTEGGMGEAVTADQKQNAREQAKTARDKRVAAVKSGNNQEAQYWDQKERDALSLMEKPQSLIGTDGRIL